MRQMGSTLADVNPPPQMTSSLSKRYVVEYHQRRELLNHCSLYVLERRSLRRALLVGPQLLRSLKSAFNPVGIDAKRKG